MEQLGFIVGTGRCGSTITAKLLNAHSAVVVPHELQILVSIGNGDRLHDKFVSGEAAGYGAEEFIALIAGACPYRFEEYFDYAGYLRGLEYPQRDAATLSRGLFAAICRDRGKRVFLEQTPWYGQRLDTLGELFPELKVLHLLRDGRDVAISFARTPWWHDDIEQNLLQWAREVVAIAEWGARHPDRYRALRYEDLVADPEGVLGRGLALFGLDFEPAMLDPANLIRYEDLFRGRLEGVESHRKHAWDVGGNRALFAGSVGAWRDYPDYDFETRTPRSTAGALALFGYE